MEIRFTGLYGAKKPSSSKAKKKSAASNEFESHVFASSSKSDVMAEASSSMSILAAEVLTGVQELDPDLKEKKRAAKLGYALLNSLKDWQKKLLLGALTEADLIKLERLIHQLKEKPFKSPDLESALAEIELRAAVELAKVRRDAESL